MSVVSTRTRLAKHTSTSCFYAVVTTWIHSGSPRCSESVSECERVRPEPLSLAIMQISSVNDVKIYNLSHGKSLPEVRTTWLNPWSLTSANTLTALTSPANVSRAALSLRMEEKPLLTMTHHANVTCHATLGTRVCVWSSFGIPQFSLHPSICTFISQNAGPVIEMT